MAPPIPGPMGQVLDPAIFGLEQTHQLPNASTFCGRCESVCPMMIPLPKLMRHWRDKEFERGLTPATQRRGLRFWAFFARRPRLYRLATASPCGRSALGARRGRFRRLPFAGGWTRTATCRPPPGRTFMAVQAARATQ